MATKRVTTGEKKTSAPKRVRSTSATAAAPMAQAPMAQMIAEVIAFRPDHETVARRAYELFQSRGMSHGRDVDDWLAAERELTQR